MLKRIPGVLGMIVGVLGMLISLALVVAVWFGRGALGEQVVALAAVVDDGLIRADQALEQINTPLIAARAKIQRIAADAERLSQQGTLDRRAAQALSNRIEREFGVDYSQIRESYIVVRERTGALIGTASRLNSVIPGAAFPPLPVDELEALDARLRDIDATLVRMRSDLDTDTLPLSTAVGRVSDGAMQIDGRLESLSALVSAFDTRLANMRVGVQGVRDTLQRWITIGTVLLTLLLLYGALLHVSLFAHGRSWFRAGGAPPPSSRGETLAERPG